MKNKISALLAAIMIFSAVPALSGCSNKDSGQQSEQSASDTSEILSDSSEKETQPEETGVTEKTESETSETEEATAENTTGNNSSEEIVQEDEVILEVDSETSDEKLIRTAQQLYDSACRVNWNFHVGCPYSLDYDSYINNSLGWQYYLIEDSTITSLADVEADYNKVFSDKYSNDLNEIYMEKDGRVYALDGVRGANIYYESSKITAVKKQTENEIFFEVEDYYSGDDFSGNKPITEKREFSAVITENGSWRAGLFTLPY